MSSGLGIMQTEKKRFLSFAAIVQYNSRVNKPVSLFYMHLIFFII
jgi:hypothetical protein